VAQELYGGPETFTVVNAQPVPTAKQQCKNGGWRTFGTTFKNQGQCVAFVRHQARAACQAQRARIGRAAFRARYGQGRPRLSALRRCVRLRSS
jgi:hypothetical protein